MNEITLTYKPSAITVNGPEEDEHINLPEQVNVTFSAKAIAALKKWAELVDMAYNEANSNFITRGTFRCMKFRADSLIVVNSCGTATYSREIIMFPSGTCCLRFALGKYSETTYEVSIPAMRLTSQVNQIDADNEH